MGKLKMICMARMTKNGSIESVMIPKACENPKSKT